MVAYVVAVPICLSMVKPRMMRMFFVLLGVDAILANGCRI